MLAVKGTIIPSTLQDVTLVASINGHTVEGESKIPKQNAPISHVFLKPDGAQVNPEAAQAILNAELIVIGPGSLYTSILPNLLVEGMVEAIKASPALKVYICNLRVAARRDRRLQRRRLPAGDPRACWVEFVRLRAGQLQPRSPAHRRPISGDLQT